MFASVLVSVSLLTLPTLLPADYVVSEVRETRVFAGRLGHRVHPILILRGSERTHTVHLPSYHTRFRPAPPAFRRGDVVTLVGGTVRRSR